MSEQTITVPDFNTVDRIGLIGFGQMGHTVTTAIRIAGLEVYVFEPDGEVIKRNTKKVAKYLGKMIDKGKLTGTVDDHLGGLHFLEKEEDMANSGVPIVLETVLENLPLKLEIFSRLSQVMPPETIWWTNTSCLSVTMIAGATGHPERCLGVHFMNPSHVMPGVEIVTQLQLDEQVLEFTLGMVKRLDKITSVTTDVAGFIVNKLLVPYLIDAFQMVSRGQATTGDTDNAIKYCLSYPMGPCRLTDLIGFNTMVLIADAIYEQTQDPRFILPEFFRAMLKAGYNGCSTQRGFYDYSDDPRNPQPIAFADLAKPAETADA